MGGSFLGGIRLFIEAAAWGEIDLAANDRLDAFRTAFLVELNGAEEVAVIAQGERGHFELHGTFDQVWDAAGSVEKAVFSVDVEMDKGIRRRHGFILRQFRGRARRNVAGRVRPGVSIGMADASVRKLAVGLKLPYDSLKNSVLLSSSKDQPPRDYRGGRGGFF